MSLCACPTRIASTSGHLLGDQGRGVLRVRQRVAVRRAGVGARVRGDDHDVAAQLLQPRHEDLRLLDQAGELHPALDVGLVPDRDAGVGQAEDADLDLDAVVERELLDEVRREHRLLGGRVDRVGTEQREVQLRLEGAQVLDAVVELVVAERGGVVPAEVHRGRHRVGAAVGDRRDPGVVVGQRGALDGVAGVDGDDRLAAVLALERLDQGGHLGDADVVGRGIGELGVLEVVPVEDVAVQVGGAEHGQPGPGGAALRGAGGGGAGGVADRGEGGGAGEDGTARGGQDGLRHGDFPRVSRGGTGSFYRALPRCRQEISGRFAGPQHDLHLANPPRTA